ncbi:MAG: hypothetical protein ACREHD_17530, partial [Pirellulales bacterium]
GGWDPGAPGAAVNDPFRCVPSASDAPACEAPGHRRGKPRGPIRDLARLCPSHRCGSERTFFRGAKDDIKQNCFAFPSRRALRW